MFVFEASPRKGWLVRAKWTGKLFSEWFTMSLHVENEIRQRCFGISMLTLGTNILLIFQMPFIDVLTITVVITVHDW